VIPHILRLMSSGTRVGIVTAAGYTASRRYYDRLYGLLEALQASSLPASAKQNLVVIGGEANYCFKFDSTKTDLLDFVPRQDWLLDEMLLWTEEDITELLDVAEHSLRDCITYMHLPAEILRKDRAVGIVPKENYRMSRETLEETVLVTQKILEMSAVGRRLPFCAFNGGNDVFVDIGDKSWGVLACQRFFGKMEGRDAPIEGGKSLHVGDQFLSAGANDFKVSALGSDIRRHSNKTQARLACTTAWIASPLETCQLLDELVELNDLMEQKTK
jgi:IMP and pyridine-specific 5'-nucleotidase